MTPHAELLNSLNSSNCPVCGKSGKPVSCTTLGSLLKPGAIQRLEQCPHYFCSNPDCDVVYYGGLPGQTFRRNDMIVRVGLKEKAAPRTVCYCFNHTIEEITEEINRFGHTRVLDDIKRRMKSACWCETKNPQGTCCLASVTKCVKTILVGSCSSCAAREGARPRAPRG